MITDSYLVDPVREYYEKQYSNPSRTYHTHQHIKDMFAFAYYHGMMLSEEQTAAIFFHDIIYMIPNNDIISNEAKSANYAYNIMKEYHNYDHNRATIVKNIILDTEYHLPVNGGDWSLVVLDLDLWALYDIKSYKKNALLIRKEYSYYKWTEFLEGRRKWLEKMLARDIVYQSVYHKPEMNDLAFRNMELEKINTTSTESWINFCMN